jgi:tellurite resistance protein TehB
MNSDDFKNDYADKHNREAQSLIFNSKLKLNEISISMLQSVAIKILDLGIVLSKNGSVLNNIKDVEFEFDEYSVVNIVSFTEISLETGSGFDFINYFKYYFGPVLLVSRHKELAELIRRSDYIDSKEYLAIKFPLLSKLLTIENERLEAFFLRIYQFLTLSPISYYFYMKSYGLYFFSIIMKLMSNSRSSKEKVLNEEKMLHKIKEYLIELNEFDVNGRWSEYHTDYDMCSIINSDNNWRKFYENERAKKISELLECKEPGSLLDLGANQGYFSFLAVKLGYNVKALDHDHGAINKLYNYLKTTGFKYKIRPAVVDFIRLNQDECKRFNSHTTLALGFIHHMRLVELLSWTKISTTLSALTENTLITEFKPGTNARAAFIPEDVVPVDDYNVESFIDSLKVHFKTVELCGTYRQHEDGGERQIITCEK